jgi:hypothetical protein
MTEPTESDQGWQQESKKTTEVAAFVAGGGVLSSGAVVAGTATIGVGLLPIAALGMVVGLAAYGVKRALFDDVKSPPTSPPDESAISQDDGGQTHSNAEISASANIAGD